MKFREWKKEIQNENFEIPDVYDLIKSTAYSKELKLASKPKLYRSLSLRKLTYSFMPILLIAIIFTIFSIGNHKINIFNKSISGAAELSYFSNEDELYSLLLANRDSQEDYQYAANTGIFSFFNNPKNAVNPNSADFTILNNSSTQSNRIDNADIVQVDGNNIYYANANNFTAFKTDNGVVEILYQEEYSANNLRVMFNNSPYKNNILVTDNYIIFIYTDDPEIRFTDSESYLDLKNYFGSNHFVNRVIIYNKQTFTKVKTYEVEGQLLDSRLINNSLYLVTNVNFSGYLSKMGKVPLPKILIDGKLVNVRFSDIAYTDDKIGESFSIISTIDLNNQIKCNQHIQLTNKVWDIIYSTKENLYLINSFINLNDSKYVNGKYTSIYKYKLNQSNITYSSSCTYLGDAANSFAFNEYNGYLRVATTSTTYKTSLFNANDRKIESNNRILIFEEKLENETKSLKIVGQLNGLGKSHESINFIRFNKDQAIIYTDKTKNYIDLKDPYKPKLIEQTQDDSRISLYHLDNEKTNAVSLNYSGNLVYRLSFYKIENNIANPYKTNSEYEIKSSFIESINNPRAIFLHQNSKTSYFGFAGQKIVLDGENTDLSYILFIVDLNNNSFDVKMFSHGSFDYIRRMVNIQENQNYFYTISNGKIVSYNSNFEIVNTLTI